MPFHGPYIDTPDFLPRTERSEAGKRSKTNDCIDLETGERGPLLTDNRPDDERETVEKVAEACEGEVRIDESATMRTSSDDDGGYGRRRLHRWRSRTGEEEGKCREEDDAWRDYA